MNEYKIEDLLFEELILMDQEASDYEDLITQIGELAFEKGYVDKEFSKAVIDREKLYPTGLPPTKVTVAIPHAMVRDNVKKSAIIISKLKKPVLFKEMGSSQIVLFPLTLSFC
jgi:PTS system galactitol-specific IIA component